METQWTTPGEAGFSLIELIVVMTMLTVVLGSVLTVVERTARISGDDRERAQAIHTAQVELDGVVREARQAFRVNVAGGNVLDVTVHRSGTTRRLVFDCSGAHPTLAATRRCTRREMLADGSLTAPRVVIDRVRNPAVFAYEPDATTPNHVGVTVEVPAAGERTGGYKELIRLNDGFAVRNRGLGT